MDKREQEGVDPEPVVDLDVEDDADTVSGGGGGGDNDWPAFGAQSSSSSPHSFS